MRPAPRFPLQARSRRLRPPQLPVVLAALAATCAGGWAGPGRAQDRGDQDSATGSAETLTPPVADPLAPDPLPPTPAPDKPVTDLSGPVSFEADAVEYDDNSQTVTAKGNVVLRREADGQSARSDTVTWNRNTGQILATGNVRLIDQDGNQLFTERAELTDELKTGAIENLLLALREGGRIAAVSGTRGEDGQVVLARAAYTACDIEDRNGCPKEPSWRVTARRVIYDPDDKHVRFEGAKLRVFGLVALPLPGLSINTDGRPNSGFLVPTFRSSPSNGVEIGGSYYWKMANNRDLTLSGYAFTDAPPMASAQYRALTDRGAYQITGYATTSRRIPVNGTNATTETGRELRGYVFANGRFQLSPEWSVSGSIRRVTDRTFLRRYDISRDDRLRSTVEIARVDTESYLSIAGWATQTLRVGELQGQVPLALPVIDYRRRLADPVLGGRVQLQANTLAITRSAGQDTQRGFASAQWDLSRITRWGQEVTFTALMRGDVYHSDDIELNPTASYRGDAGWQGRAVALAAVDVKWPFVGNIMGGRQVLTPRVQMVAAPSIRNLAIPNEDARAIDLEDTNLFSLNRFPGYDRIEDGVRFTYGVDWLFERPSWRVMTTIGQSYRLSRQPSLAPDGTGLSSRMSDIVGRTEVRYRDFFQITHRYRLDKDSFAIRRNEVNLTVGDHQTYLEVGYVRLNRNIEELEDLRDREEVRAAGRVAFAKYWSVFGSGVVNLTDRHESAAAGTDGFQPLRTRIGALYSDDCIELGLTWRRDYQTRGDARRGNTFQVRLALKNLGFR